MVWSVTGWSMSSMIQNSVSRHQAHETHEAVFTVFFIFLVPNIADTRIPDGCDFRRGASFQRNGHYILPIPVCLQCLLYVCMYKHTSSTDPSSTSLLPHWNILYHQVKLHHYFSWWRSSHLTIQLRSYVRDMLSYQLRTLPLGQLLGWVSFNAPSDLLSAGNETCQTIWRTYQRGAALSEWLGGRCEVPDPKRFPRYLNGPIAVR